MNTLFYSLLDTIGFAIMLIFPLQVMDFKKHRRIYYVMYIVSFTLLVCLSVIFRGIEALKYNPMKSFLQLGIFISTLMICYKNKPMQKIIAIFMMLFSNLLGEASASFIYLFDLPFSGTVLSYLCSIFSIIVLLIALAICRGIYAKVFSKKMFSSKAYMFDIVLGSQTLCFISPVYSLGQMLGERSDRISEIIPYVILLSVTMIVCAVADVFLFRILITNAENYELKEEVKLLRIKSEYELEYYNKIKANIAETRKISHDLSNLIMVLKSDDLNPQRKDNIIEELSRVLKKSKVRTFCENELVNIILNNKLEAIQNNGIEFTASLDIPDKISIKDIDLCRIFTNIIDNAIDACTSCTQQSKTIISLTSAIRDDYIIIGCTNSFNGSIRKKGSKLLSTKPQHEGLGIEILKDIVSGYSGDISTEATDDTFNTTLLLKLE